MPSFFLKVASYVIAPYLLCFSKFSFDNGVFSDIANILPIITKDDRHNPTDYRAISILTCFSKIVERLVYTRRFKFISKHKVIIDTLYGFQKNISTEHALIDVVTANFDNFIKNSIALILKTFIV